MTDKSENITATQTSTNSQAAPEISSDNNSGANPNKTKKTNVQTQSSQSLSAISDSRMLRVAIVTCIIFLIVIVVSGILAVRYQQQTNSDLIISLADLNNKINNLEHDEKIDNLSTSIKQTFDEHQTSSQHLSDQIKQLQQQQNELSAQATQTQQHLQGDARYWMQHEVMHLLRMAVHRLTLSYDIKGALAALQAADSRITELNDSTLLNITESIQQQVKKLSNLTMLDTANLHAQIETIRNELRSALLDGQHHNNEESISNEAHSSQQKTPADTSMQTTTEQVLNASQSFLLKLMESAKALFNDSVQVTHGQQDSSGFLKHQNNRHIYEVVHIRLSEAQHAITQRNDEAYKKQLDAAIQGIEAHPGFPNQASISNNIQALSEINLTPPLPDISQPKKLLAEKIAQSKVSK